MYRMSVMYPTKEGATFDFDYYRQTHMPLALEKLKPFGMIRFDIDRGISADDFDGLREQWPPFEHPVVRTHPVTGRKALFLNYNTGCRLKGLTSSENDRLLPFLFDHVRSPEFQCRFHWEANSVAFWDNRCVQHFGVPDYFERRVMHRVTIDGDEPY